jgi:hypothetical protein
MHPPDYSMERFAFSKVLSTKEPRMKPAIFTLMTLMITTPALASENVCMSAPEMEASLIDWYGEAPVAGSGSETTQMWAADATGSWTLVQYLADGNACVLAQGEDWSPERTDEMMLAVLAD